MGAIILGGQFETSKEQIGNLNNLDTINKNNIVSSINEINAKIQNPNLKYYGKYSCYNGSVEYINTLGYTHYHIIEYNDIQRDDFNVLTSGSNETPISIPNDLVGKSAIFFAYINARNCERLLIVKGSAHPYELVETLFDSRAYYGVEDESNRLIGVFYSTPITLTNSNYWCRINLVITDGEGDWSGNGEIYSDCKFGMYILG